MARFEERGRTYACAARHLVIFTPWVSMNTRSVPLLICAERMMMEAKGKQDTWRRKEGYTTLRSNILHDVVDGGGEHLSVVMRFGLSVPVELGC